MPAYYRPTLAESFRDLNAGESAYIVLGNFLDDFYGTVDAPERRRLLADEPEAARSEEARRWSCFYAALAEWFSDQYGLPTPPWVHDQKYVLPEPWMMMTNHRLHPELRATSPPPFAARNVFCGDRIFMRA